MAECACLGALVLQRITQIVIELKSCYQHYQILAKASHVTALLADSQFSEDLD